VAERYADGQATDRELKVAEQEAYTAEEAYDPYKDDFLIPPYPPKLEETEPMRRAAQAANMVTSRDHESAAIVAHFALHAIGTGVDLTAESETQAAFLRDIFGNPFRQVTFSPEWRTDTAIALACTMYESRDFSAMPILADALQDAGCDNDDVLNHCRGTGPHVRGCWVCDLVLGKE
jgi:hypothetical protein